MKITVFALALFLLQFTFANELFAQKGKNEIAIGAEIGPVIDDFAFSYQYGLPVKAYFGIGTSGQLMLRSGIHSFQVSNLYEAWESINMYMIPVALGYRQNFNKFYIEPSIGAARSMHTHILANPRETYKRNENEIHYGLEFGYQIKGFDIGFSINNTGPIPYNLFFSGFKALYKFEL